MFPLHSAILTSTVLLLGVSASPLIPRDNATTSLLKPETYGQIQSWLNATEIPGLVVAIATSQGDQVIPFGVSDRAGTPVTEDTYFPIGSNTKLITAVTLNLLASQNITLDNGETFTVNTKVKDVLPDFQMWNASSAQEATVLDFLSHQSGIPAWVLAVRPNLTPQGWSDELRDWNTTIGLREGFQYSNLNYAIISYVIEKLSGKSYSDTVQELIFDPLELGATFNASEVKERGTRSQGFLKQGVNATKCVLDFATSLGTNTTTSVIIPPSCLGVTEAFEFWTNSDGEEWTGGGSAIFRGKDMLAWAKEIVRPHTIPPQVIADVQQGVVQSSLGNDIFGPGFYAQGTVVETYRGYNISLHDGALPGALSLFVRVPNETIGIFVTTNDDLYGSDFCSIVTLTILDELLNLPPIDWFSRVLGLDSSSSNSTNSTSSTSEGTTASTAFTPPTSPRPAPDGYLNQTFRAAGFSDFTLQQLYINDTDSIEEAAFPLDYLLTDYVSSGGTFLTTGPVYYGYWGQSVADRIFFTHFDGPVFNMTAVKVYDRVKGDFEIQQVPVNGSQYIAKVYGAAPVVFAESGIGFFGSFWNSGVFVDVSETDVREKAITFFGRVDT